MKRLSLCLFLLGSSLGAQLDLGAITIPRKTEIFVKLERALSSKTSLQGERFHGRIEVPVILDDQIILPAGSFILGQVESVHKPGYFKGTGEVELSFDTVILPDGTTRQIRAIPQSVEEQKMGTGFDEGKIQANSQQADEVIKAATVGAASGGTVGGATEGISGLGIGSVVGAATGAVVGLIFRGKHLTLPKGTSLTIQLEHDARFVTLEGACGTRKECSVKGIEEEFCIQAACHLRDDFLPKIEKAVNGLEESEVWWRPNEVSNSVGNLLLHLAGNVRQWIMGGLDHQPDTRTRDAEFAACDGYSKQHLLERLRETVLEASRVIEGLTEERLMAKYHVQIYDASGVKAVIHVVEHFSYHVGQILYITKLLKNEDLGFYSNLKTKQS